MDEALPERVGDGGPEDESPGLGSEDEVEVLVLHEVDEAVYRHAEAFAVAEDGRYVPEEDPFLGEVGDLGDIVLQFFHAWR